VIVILLLIILCLFVILWHSDFGKRTGLSGEYGTIADTLWGTYFKIKYFIEWIFESAVHVRMISWVLVAIALILFFVAIIYKTINPFSVYKVEIMRQEEKEYNACVRNLKMANNIGDVGKIQEALESCKKSKKYQRVKNYPKFLLDEYNACQNDISDAMAANDLRKARKVYESWKCRSNIYFFKAKGYPEFNAEKYVSCQEDIKTARGVTRLTGRDFREVEAYCFRKHRGPLADPGWITPNNTTPD